jgi:ferredoxin
MSATIYYFSGSGNSLFVARELQKRVPGSELIPLVSLLSRERIRAESETIGFVFPVHCTTLPVPVKQFLAKLELDSNKYLFAVVTQGGAWPRLVELHLEQIVKEKGRRLDAFFSVKMPWSSPVGLMPVYIPGMIEYPKPEEKISVMTSSARKKLDLVQNVIEGRNSAPADDFPRSIGLPFKQVVCKLMGPATTGIETNSIDFYADGDCTGCGTCAEVCLSQRISMVDGEPVWQEDVQCYFCYACFSFCPEQAVMVRDVYSKKGDRYFHPDVTPVDIAAQKE